MNHHQRSRHFGQLLLGLTVVAIGALLVLNNLHYVNLREYTRFWPVLIMVLGLAKLLCPRGSGGRLFGLLVLLFGTGLLLHRLNLVTWNVWDLWPLLLVLLGFGIIRSAFRPRRMSCGYRSGTSEMRFRRHGGPEDGAPPAEISDEPTIDRTIVFAGESRGSNSQDFRGGRIQVIMAGCEMDLRQASIAAEEAVLEVLGVVGGIVLRVPEDWNVVVRATQTLGGVDNKARRQPSGTGKRLVITGRLYMAGLEIRN